MTPSACIAYSWDDDAHKEWKHNREQRRARERTLREEHQGRIEDVSKHIRFD